MILRSKQKRVVLGIILLTIVLVAFMYWPLPISSPESALRVARSRFSRTMWLHFWPRHWLWIRSELRQDNHYGLRMQPFPETLRQTFADPKFDETFRFPFYYGSPQAIADCKEPLWIVSFADNPLTDSTHTFVLRARNGQFVAIYFVPGE